MDGQNTGGDIMEIVLYFVVTLAGFGIGVIAELLYEKLCAFCAKRRKMKKSKKST